VFKLETTGGTDKNHLSMNGLGAYSTDYDTYNFASKPVHVYAAANGDFQAALNSFKGLSMLAAWEGKNVKTVASHSSSVTLTAGKRIVNPVVVCVTTAASALSGDAVITVGNNSTDYNNIMIGVVNAVAVEQQVVSGAESTRGTGYNSGNGGVIYLNITGADSGTSGTSSFYLFGTIV
jgi:hypothetical protein